MTPVLAIDPGSEQSAWLLWDGYVARFGIYPNSKMLAEIRRSRPPFQARTVVIEEIESYGMAVGREVFETVRWAGRFEEACAPTRVVLMPRRKVKLALCGSARAKDSNIRQALLDRFGGSAAKGTKAAPGPLYGISKDVWSALAIAVTYSEQEG